MYQPHHAAKTINENKDMTTPIKVLIPKYILISFFPTLHNLDNNIGGIKNKSMLRIVARVNPSSKGMVKLLCKK